MIPTFAFEAKHLHVHPLTPTLSPKKGEEGKDGAPPFFSVAPAAGEGG